MDTDAAGTDKAIGLGIAFAALALFGAVLMYGAPTQEFRAWGFALAIVAALVGITALHLWS